MSEERFQVVKRLLGEALEKPVDRREAWLQEVCTDDAALLEEVLALIRAPDAGSMNLAGRMTPLIKEDLEGLRLGPWRLVRELGQGGMGTVWLAERDDQSFEMIAAVKLVARERLYPELVGRFRRERQILANLKHPNIAGLIDGGTTTDGRPYLVMEYVDGLPVDAWCREHQPSQTQVLEIVHCLCEAVAYAHRKGVIHRDIKCANVMLTGSGDVKLMDFGIARLVDHAAQRDLNLTASGERPMTPEFAAPEQLAGNLATRQSDIHGLGLVLFQLLTGLRPRELETTPFDALSAPIIPHARVFADAPEPLPAGLRQILRNALAPNLQDRYASVDQMSSALSAWLEGRHDPKPATEPLLSSLAWKTLPGGKNAPPVSETEEATAEEPGADDPPAAPEPDPAPSSRKQFPTRFAIAVLAVVLLGLLPLLFSARRELALDRQYHSFLAACAASEQQSMLADPPRDEAIRLERIAQALLHHQDLEPEVRARLQFYLAERFQAMGRPDRAATLAQKAYETWRALAQARGTSDALELLAWVEANKGSLNQALATASEAAELIPEINRTRRMRALRTLGWMQFRNGDPLNGSTTLEEALTYAAPNPRAQTLAADCMARLGEVRHSQARYPEAEFYLRDALHQWRQLEGPLHPRVADCLEQLALVLEVESQPVSALPLLREALAIRRTLLGADAPEVTRIASTLSRLESDMR